MDKIIFSVYIYKYFCGIKVLWVKNMKELWKIVYS